MRSIHLHLAVGLYIAELIGGCTKPDSVPYKGTPPPVSSFPATLQAATALEKSVGSTDVSFKYNHGIDTSLYPNSPHFDLKKVKRFMRPSSEDGIEYTIEYFMTSDDSIRTILHEWSVAEQENDNPVSHLAQRIIIERFERKFTQLDSNFTALIGLPTLRDIKQGYFIETEKDDVKWPENKTFNAYLFMFKRDKNIYRQIRAVTYLQ